jgi:hypothetical protein
MKHVAKLGFLALAVLLISGCAKDSDDTGSTDGTLAVKMRTWNTYTTGKSTNANVALNDTIILDLVDVKTYKYEMSVTRDNLYAGMDHSEIKWIPIYESDLMMDDSDRDFNFTLTEGAYKGM